MRSYRRSLILVTSLALMPLAGVASAGQARPRSAPPAQGSSSSGSSSTQGSSSQGSSSQQGRSRTEAQPRQRESTPPPQQQQSQRQEQTRERQTEREPQRETTREREQVQQQQQREQAQRQQNDSRDNNSSQDNSRQAVPAPRDRYIDLNRDGRNDNRDSRVLGPQDRRDLERRYDNNRYDGRYDRYDSRYSNYSPYRYNGPRVVFAPRESVRFSRPWFSFRPLIRLPFGLTLGVAQSFPSWYRPYIVGRPGYTSPYMPYGGVTFDIEPRDAELWIDGDYIGRVSDYSYNDPPLTLVAGSHYVELRSRYGRPLAFDITVIPGQVIPYQGTLPYYR